MPCSDGIGPMYGDSSEVRELRKRNDKLAQMLCDLCQSLENRRELWVHLPNVVGLNDWWTEHKKIDAERIERENFEREQANLKNKALAKLTKAERQALGL